MDLVGHVPKTASGPYCVYSQQVCAFFEGFAAPIFQGASVFITGFSSKSNVT